jgi:serpin B
MSKYNTSMTNTSELVLRLPRFRVEFGIALMNKALQNLGVTKSFTDASGFQRMTPGCDTVIRYVYHKACAEVDEEGTVAAAATAVVMTKGGKPRMPAIFSVDRPFLFGIQHVETGAFVFLGKIVDP